MKAKKESKKTGSAGTLEKMIKQPRTYTVSEHRKAVKKAKEKLLLEIEELHCDIIILTDSNQKINGDFMNAAQELSILKDSIEREALPEIVALNKQLADAETDRDNFKAGFENYRTLYHEAIEKSITRRIINWWTRRKAAK